MSAHLTFSRRTARGFALLFIHSSVGGEEPTNMTQIGVVMSSMEGGSTFAIAEGHCGYTMTWPLMAPWALGHSELLLSSLSCITQHLARHLAIIASSTTVRSLSSLGTSPRSM